MFCFFLTLCRVGKKKMPVCKLYPNYVVIVVVSEGGGKCLVFRNAKLFLVLQNFF